VRIAVDNRKPIVPVLLQDGADSSCIPSFRFDDVLGRMGWVMGGEAFSDPRRQV
jgi:hypothetical protein